MVDPSAVGARGAPFPVEIERGKVHEFARALGATDEAYYREWPIAPPTFLTTTFFWEALVAGSNPWPLVRLDPQRGMHAEQEYVFHGPPPRSGTRLVATSRIEAVYEKEGRRGGKLGFGVMVTEFRDGDGRLVAEARLVGVETARAPESP
jgi:hypothetical protein